MQYVYVAKQHSQRFCSVLPLLKLMSTQPLCHHQMMSLVVGADCHQAKEPQSLNPVGVAVNDQSDTILEFFC